MTGFPPQDTPSKHLQLMEDPDLKNSLRPILKTVLQTGGVPPAMAEGIADILEEAGYASFGPTDDVTLRRRKARALHDMDPEKMEDRLQHKGAAIAAEPDVQATHSRLLYERIAAREFKHLRLKPLQLTPEQRVLTKAQTIPRRPIR